MVTSTSRATTPRAAAGGETTASARWPLAALAVGAVLMVVHAAVPDWGGRSLVYLTVGTFGTALSCIGAARMPTALRRIWWALAAGQGLFLLGDVLWILFEEVLDIEPYPSVADVAYLASYPAVALGLMWLVKSRSRGRDRAAILDAALLATAFTVVVTVFFVAPAAQVAGQTPLAQVVAGAYPAADLLVLALVGRMLTTGIGWNPSLSALVGGLAAILFVDLFYVVSVVNDSAYPAWIDHGYLASYVLLGFAAVHPSARLLSDPAPARPERVTVFRLAWLGAALMVAPIVDRVAAANGLDRRLVSWVVVLGGCVAAVLVVLRIWELVQSLQHKAGQLAALARRDALTGIANRRTWEHELSRACTFAKEEGTALVAAVVDMDNFKQFNDEHGHLRGDLVLKETAQAWASILHGRGFVARFGGEEFTVLLPNISASEAEALLERLRRSVTHDQTCSIGMAMWDGEEPPNDLVARADQALYHAKREGRDRIAVHDGSKVAARLWLEQHDPAEDSLRMAYQPIVELATGHVIGFEALSRFDGQSPRDVFDTALRHGTGASLEAAAIRLAVERWNGVGLLAVNASLATLVTPQVQAALPDDLSSIIVEITETDLVDYTPEVMLTIERLRERGVAIAIDDFGSGYSSMHRLVTLQPDLIKLDISLVRGIDSNRGLQAMVAATLLFAERTNARVIAEGIETAEERDCLIDAGVTLGQGYLLGVPQPTDPGPRARRASS